MASAVKSIALQKPPADQPTTAGETYQSAEAVEAWRRAAARRAETYGAATELMLDLAEIGPGCRVLDVAAGAGDQTLLAARRVGPSGYVLAVDISAAMLAVAADAASEAGLTNVETCVLDARSLDLESDSFDAAISRFGIMLIPDPVKALAEAMRVLKPGGKLSVAVFSTPEKNPYLAIPQAIARRHAGLPEPAPGDPGQFALGAPGAVENAYAKAGFRVVRVLSVSTTRRFASTEEAIQTMKDTSVRLRQLMDGLSDAERDRVWSDVEQELNQFQGSTGLELAGEVLVCVGTK